MTDLVIVSEAADGRGGASLAAIASAKAFAATGMNVHFFAATGPISSDLATIRTFVLADGYDLMKASPLERARTSFWNSGAASAFRDFVRELSPETTLVHVHSFAVQLTASVIDVARMMGFPIVLTAHDYVIACPYSGFYNYNTGAPCGKTAQSLACAVTLCTESKNPVGKLWHLAKARVQSGRGGVPSEIDHLVFPSDFCRSILRPYLSEKVPTTVVRNVVDIPKQAPRELGRDAPFLFVGRMTREKGALLAAQAARQIGAPLTIVGTGPEETEVAQAYPDVKMFGWQDREGVTSAMRAARALVFPSRWFESTPGLVVEEARAVGLPCIVSDITAAAYCVRQGIDGLHFQSGNAEHLAAQMLALMDDRVATAMGLAAHKAFWADSSTPPEHVEATRAVYRDVWARRKQT